MKETWSFALKFMQPQERLTVGALVAGRLLAGFLDLLGVLIIGYLATSTAVFLSEGDNRSKTVTLGGFVLPAITGTTLPFFATSVLLLFLTKAILSVTLTRATAIRLAKIEARASASVAAKLFGSGLENAKRYSIDEVMFSIQVGASAIYSGFMNNVVTILSEGFLFFLLVGTLLLVSPGATIAVLLYFGLLAYAIQIVVGRQLSKASDIIASNSVKTYGTIGDLYSSYREIFVSGRVPFFIDSIYKTRMEATQNIGRQVYLLGMPRYIVETALLFGIVAFGLAQTLSGDVISSAATFGIVLTGGMRIMAAMLPWQTALASLKQNVPLAKSALEILQLQPGAETNHWALTEVSNTRGPVKAVAVELNDVSFKYENAEFYAVSNISLKVVAGSQVALIGNSGAGKSTSADLIAGLVQPQEGNVLIDGMPANKFVSTHPGAVAYVPQKPGMLLGTLLENIAVGPKNEIDLAKVQLVVQQANLGDVIAALPDGIDSDIGKHRDSLSGGQLQRLGLARALYSDCKLLLLDEATSGLDAHSEAAISETLESLRGRVTVIMIAHRLHTVQTCDEVFYFENGKVQTSGKFQDLLKSNPQISSAVKLMAISDSEDQ